MAQPQRPNHLRIVSELSPKLPPSRVTRLGASVRRFAEGLTGQGMDITSPLHIQRIADGAANRSNRKHNLGAQSGNTKFEGSFKSRSLIETAHHDGMREDLTHLIFLGGQSVVALTREVVKVPESEGGTRLRAAHAILLPVGIQWDKNKGPETPSSALLSVYPDETGRIGSSGVVHSLDQNRVAINRGVIYEHTGVADGNVSRDHAMITFHNGEGITVDDLDSSFGTYVINSSDLYTSPEQGGLDVETNGELQRLLARLDKDPTMWTAAGRVKR